MLRYDISKEEYDATLPAWDGRVEGLPEAYPADQVEYWDMRRDPDDGTVYYCDWGNPRKVCAWCSGSRLRAHLIHLAQVRARA